MSQVPVALCVCVCVIMYYYYYMCIVLHVLHLKYLLVWIWIVSVHMWRSENSFLELVLYFHYVDFRTQTQAMRFSGKYFYLMR